MNQKRSVALDRHLNTYPSIKNLTLVNAYAKEYQVSKSSLIDDALKMFFDAMPQEKRIQLLNSKIDNKF